MVVNKFQEAKPPLKKSYDAWILLFGPVSRIRYLIGYDTCPILSDTRLTRILIDGHEFDVIDTRILHLRYTYPAFRIHLHFQKKIMKMRKLIGDIYN